jgi:cyclopropane fatty-acyl-phospholipid synthase-like methyltransferase
MTKTKDWNNYYEVTKNNPPTRLLVDALKYLEDTETKKSLELGAGSPKDSIFLLQKEFEVTAIDKSDASKELFGSIKEDIKFTYINKSFSDFDYQEDTYSLISAQRALPFLQSKEELDAVVFSIKKSLTKGGVFVGHFFGMNDTWAKLPKNKMTFIDKDVVLEYFKDMKIRKIVEREEDSQSADGTPKHWHVFEIIAVKE